MSYYRPITLAYEREASKLNHFLSIQHSVVIYKFVIDEPRGEHV